MITVDAPRGRDLQSPRESISLPPLRRPHDARRSGGRRHRALHQLWQRCLAGPEQIGAAGAAVYYRMEFGRQEPAGNVLLPGDWQNAVPSLYDRILQGLEQWRNVG